MLFLLSNFFRKRFFERKMHKAVKNLIRYACNCSTVVNKLTSKKKKNYAIKEKELKESDFYINFFSSDVLYCQTFLLVFFRCF